MTTPAPTNARPLEDTPNMLITPKPPPSICLTKALIGLNRVHQPHMLGHKSQPSLALCHITNAPQSLSTPKMQNNALHPTSLQNEMTTLNRKQSEFTKLDAMANPDLQIQQWEDMQ